MNTLQGRTKKLHKQKYVKSGLTLIKAQNTKAIDKDNQEPQLRVWESHISSDSREKQKITS